MAGEKPGRPPPSEFTWPQVRAFGRRIVLAPWWAVRWLRAATAHMAAFLYWRGRQIAIWLLRHLADPVRLYFIDRADRRIGQRLLAERRGRARPPGLPGTVTMLVPDTRIDRRVLLQARTLSEAGILVTVIAATYPGPEDIDQREFPEVNIVRVPTDILPIATSRAGAGLLAEREWRNVYHRHTGFLSAARRNPADIYVAHDLPVLPATLMAAREFNVPVFYDAHELYPEQAVFDTETHDLYESLEREAAPLVDLITTVNHSIAAEMARRYGVDEPRVILNAPDSGGRPVPVPRSNLLREALDIPESTRILLFQGGLSAHRNLETLIGAMPRIATPGLVLVLMGPGDMTASGEREGQLAALARAHGVLGTRVLFHPAVPQSELLDYTASADAGIIPYPAVDLNTTFCTPNKLFEYHAAGLPILANDLPELRRYVADQGTGMVHLMRNENEIAAAIDLMFSQDFAHFRTALARRAEHMVWRSQAGPLLTLYRGFWANRPAMPRLARRAAA